MAYCRLWFWPNENKKPRVIAHGTGSTLRSAMIACFAPVGDPGWSEELRGSQLYLRRGSAGYCAEECDRDNPGPGKPPEKPMRERLAKTPKKPVRERL